MISNIIKVQQHYLKIRYIKEWKNQNNVSHPVMYQSPRTLEPTSYKSPLPALAHNAAIPTEGVRFTNNNNIYIIHQFELKQQLNKWHLWHIFISHGTNNCNNILHQFIIRIQQHHWLQHQQHNQQPLRLRRLTNNDSNNALTTKTNTICMWYHLNDKAFQGMSPQRLDG